MTGPGRDPYDVLGVSRQASAREISHAYRRGARASHPDSHPDDPLASERFKDVAAAYEILGDPNRRAAYDHKSRVVRVAVSRRTRCGAPPVRLGPHRPAPGRFDLGFEATRFEAWPARRSGPFEVNVGRPFGATTRFDNAMLGMAVDILRRLLKDGL